MARVKKGLTKRARHKKILNATSGMRGAKHKLVRSAHEALLHSGEYAFAGRKLRKRDVRALWIIRIGAALKETGKDLSYSRFIHSLKEKNIEIDRKILAQLAVEDKDVFKKIVETVSN